MSNASPIGSESFPRLGEKPRRLLELPVRFIGFWTAILVPFVLLGMIVSGTALQSPQLLSVLLGANLFGLVVGKDYKR
jgi:hypothetical protein